MVEVVVRGAEALGLEGEGTEQVPRHGVVRVRLQDLPAERFGLGDLAGLPVLESQGEDFLRSAHRDAHLSSRKILWHSAQLFFRLRAAATIAFSSLAVAAAIRSAEPFFISDVSSFHLAGVFMPCGLVGPQ